MDCKDNCDVMSVNKNEESSVLITIPVVKCETEERTLLDQHGTDIKEEYVDQSHALTSEIKIENDSMPVSFPVVKREPQEQSFFDQHVTDIKEEYVNQSPDLISQIKHEEDLVPISIPVSRHEPEEEQSHLVTVNEEPSVEVTAGNKEVFIERY
ncbi:uncharacterized protein [Periplaneta americana]|uniref:uncharacterized protein isoform X5 n=1 Tax=Periplaneta americana TaxID=6978 RepID=UPI0037E884FA